MAKRRSRTHEVYIPDPTREYVVGTISMRELRRKQRKPLPPPSQIHRSKKAYRRKPKHLATDAEEELE